MKTSLIEVVPHPQLLDALFAFKNKVSNVFNDVLGLHEISHVAIACINLKHEIQIFSSTPAMEFNLFRGNLWRFDQTYHPTWFHTCTQTSWQALYAQERYDELYYLKQIKPQYPIGTSLAVKLGDNFYIYSFASTHSCERTREFFTQQQDDFYKIGLYCVKSLGELFSHYDNLHATTL